MMTPRDALRSYRRQRRRCPFGVECRGVWTPETRRVFRELGRRGDRMQLAYTGVGLSHCEWPIEVAGAYTSEDIISLERLDFEKIRGALWRRNVNW